MSEQVSLPGVPLPPPAPEETPKAPEKKPRTFGRGARDLTEAQRKAAAKEALGKSEVEIKKQAEKLGISSGSIYSWLNIHYPDRKKKPTGTSKYTEAQKLKILKEWKAADYTEAWAAKRGVHQSTLRDWRKSLSSRGLFDHKPHKGGRSPASLQKPTVGQRHNVYPREQKIEIIKKADELQSDRAAFRAFGFPGRNATIVSKWRKELGLPRKPWKPASGTASPAPPPPERKKPGSKVGAPRRERRSHSDEFRARAVEMTRTMTVKDVATELDLAPSQVTKWRQVAGATWFPGSGGSAPPLASNGVQMGDGRQLIATALLSSEDQELLQAHDAVKTRDRNLIEKVRRLEKENLVLRANMAFAIDNGYLEIFSVEKMFSKKG